MTLLEKQQAVIRDCHRIYDHYIALEKMDWENWWAKTEPYMEKKYGLDEDIETFMHYRLQDVFRELQVMTENLQWSIKKG